MSDPWSEERQKLEAQRDRAQVARRTLTQRCQELEQALAERTAQLADQHQRRQVAEETARRAVHARATVLANMSHELRTPLNAIIGYTELLLDQVHETGARADLDRIYGAARHLLSTIDEVADLSRLDTGQLELETGPVDLDELFDHVLAETRSLAESQGNRVVVKRLEHPPPLHSDARRIEQIVVQLLRNAHRFTRLGVIRLEASLRGGRLHLSVADSGCGIPEERLELIFDVFESFDRRAHAGSGLGLAIGRRLARLLGGELTATSMVGKGSRFVLDLPCAQGLPSEAPEPPPSLPPHSAVVLLIDEDDAAREMFQRTLEGVGHIVHEASSSAEGLELARALAPDLITLDLGRHGMDGMKLVQSLRSDGFGGATLVLSTSQDRRRVLGMGADAFLTKPVTRDELLVATQQLLDDGRQGR